MNKLSDTLFNLLLVVWKKRPHEIMFRLALLHLFFLIVKTLKQSLMSVSHFGSIDYRYLM